MGYYHRCKVSGLVRPLLEYACQVWHPDSDYSMLENVQHCAARWVCGSHWNPSIKQYTTSPDDSLAELHRPTVATHHDYLSVCLLHDIFNKKITLNFSDYCTRNTSCTRAHNLCIVPPEFSINCYRYSFLYALLFYGMQFLGIGSVTQFHQALHNYFCK